MVRIRLRRIGATKQPIYRIIAAEKEAQRDGAFLEILGLYNPRTEPSTIEVKEDRIYHWLSQGAQPSESALQVFNAIGLMARFERLKKGEPAEALLAEASQAAANRPVNPKTRRTVKPKPGQKA